MVSWLRQGIGIGHSHLKPGFAYIEPALQEDKTLESLAGTNIRDSAL